MNDPVRLLESVQAALETGPVCDCCLGRCFVDERTEVAVAERGWALRVVHCMEVDEPFGLVVPAECWVCDGAADIDFDAWTDRVVEALSDLTFETFQVGTHPPGKIFERDRELRAQAGLPEDAGQTFSAVVNSAVGDRVARRIAAEQDFDHPDVVPVIYLEEETVEVRINSVYLYGRYRKPDPGTASHVRPCPDCDGTGTTVVGDERVPCGRCDGSGRLPSVEELVGWTVRDAMDASSVSFHSAGREGVDVLVVGTGRPFVLEVEDPRHRIADISQIATLIEAAASGRVEVNDLAFATSDMVGFVSQRPFRQRFRLTLEFDVPVEKESFHDAVFGLDGAPIRRHIRGEELAGGQRPHDVVRTLLAVDGTWEDERSGTVAFELESGIDPESIATGNGGTVEPSLTDGLETDVTVTEVAIVAVVGRDEAFENPAYLVDR